MPRSPAAHPDLALKDEDNVFILDDGCNALVAVGKDASKSKGVRGRGRGGAGRGRGRGRGGDKDGGEVDEVANTTGKRKYQGGSGSDNVPNKKCNKCLKTKPIEMYNLDQAVCKPCGQAKKALQRLARKQGCEEWLNQLEGQNPKEFGKMLVVYNKHRDEEAGDDDDDEGMPVPFAKKRKGGKDKCAPFPLLEYKERLVASSGVRGEAKGKMMWRDEYLEEAKLTYMGNLSHPEAMANWNIWTAKGSGVKRDMRGPRGHERVWVHMGDYESKYNDASVEKVVEGTRARKKNGYAEDAMEFAQKAVCGHDRANITGGFMGSTDAILDKANPPF